MGRTKINFGRVAKAWPARALLRKRPRQLATKGLQMSWIATFAASSVNV